MKIAKQSAVLTLVAVVVSACGSSGLADAARPDPAERAVLLETTACEFASGRTGSGVAVGGDLVVTVAHLIVRAGSVQGAVADGDLEPAAVAAVDLQRDLAVLHLGSLDAPNIEMSSIGQGATGEIVGGAVSGTVPFQVERVVDLTIEEILGTDRHSRLGYELSASTRDGDSGAGAYDSEGRLIGVVFATGQDGETTWVTASAEIDDFLSTLGPTDTYPLCE